MGIHCLVPTSLISAPMLSSLVHVARILPKTSHSPDWPRVQLGVRPSCNSDVNMAENTKRGEGFWNSVYVKMKLLVEEPWLKYMRENRECFPDLSTGGRLDEEVEDLGYKLTVVGPLIDFYLKHIGVAIRCRLRRSRKTGLTNDFSTTIPWDLMKYVCVLWREYGGNIETNSRGKKMVLSTVNFATLEKVFSPARFCGENYLKRRHYVVVRQPRKKNNHVFQGRSAVVVSEKTPFTINFRMDSGIATISFYRQNYDKCGVAQDLTLQGLVNV